MVTTSYVTASCAATVLSIPQLSELWQNHPGFSRPCWQPPWQAAHQQQALPSLALLTQRTEQATAVGPVSTQQCDSMTEPLRLD